MGEKGNASLTESTNKYNDVVMMCNLLAAQFYSAILSLLSPGLCSIVGDHSQTASACSGRPAGTMGVE